MKSLETTKKLSLVSLICIGTSLLLRMVEIFYPKCFAGLFYSELEAELPLSAQLLLVGQTACILPFGLVSLFGYLKKNSTRESAMNLLVLAPVFYLFKSIGSVVISMITQRVVYYMLDTGTVTVFSMMKNYLSWFDIFCTASLVLICCAGTLELYITKHEKEAFL